MNRSERRAIKLGKAFQLIVIGGNHLLHLRGSNLKWKTLLMKIWIVSGNILFIAMSGMQKVKERMFGSVLNMGQSFIITMISFGDCNEAESVVLLFMWYATAYF